VRSALRGFYFPAVINTRPVSQINKAREEFEEFLRALATESRREQAEEYWDHVHALEQLGRDMAEAMGGEFWMIRCRIEDKNRAKGLYAEGA
jgi:3-methyladenine DNA glycosylase Tag